MYASVPGSAPGGFAPSNGGGLLAAAKKNMLWIIGVVAGVIVLGVIVVIATKNKGATGQKDQDYVSMNAQGGRV